MNNDKLLETFRNTAIKCHIGFKHEGPWEECEWIECEDRRKIINQATLPTPTAVNSYDALRAELKGLREAYDELLKEAESARRLLHEVDRHPAEYDGCCMRGCVNLRWLIRRAEVERDERAALHPQPRETK